MDASRGVKQKARVLEYQSQASHSVKLKPISKHGPSPLSDSDLGIYMKQCKLGHGLEDGTAATNPLSDSESVMRMMARYTDRAITVRKVVVKQDGQKGSKTHPLRYKWSLKGRCNYQVHMKALLATEEGKATFEGGYYAIQRGAESSWFK